VGEICRGSARGGPKSGFAPEPVKPSSLIQAAGSWEHGWTKLLILIILFMSLFSSTYTIRCQNGSGEMPVTGLAGMPSIIVAGTANGLGVRFLALKLGMQAHRQHAQPKAGFKLWRPVFSMPMTVELIIHSSLAMESDLLVLHIQAVCKLLESRNARATHYRRNVYRTFTKAHL
jgi:hypothetical protein